MSEVRSPAEADAVRDELSEVQLLDGLRRGAPTEELRLRLRELCKSNLYFLCKVALHYERLVPRTHIPVAEFMQDLESPKLMLLLPRGCYKTTIGTIGLCIYLLINDPNQRILIVNQTSTNAERMLLEIEQHLDGTNPMMAWLFPEMIRPTLAWTPWSTSQMTIPNRTIISGTPSVQAMGIGTRMESQHFDWILEDDPVGESAMESDVEMESAKMWHTYSDALFVEVKTGKRRVLGTRWGHNDLYGEIMERERGWKIFHRPAKDWKTGELFFPEKLDEKTLAELASKNYKMFLSQYQNDASNPEALDFRPEWLHTYQLTKTDKGKLACRMGKDDFLVDDMRCGIFVDTAASGDLDDKIDKKIKQGNTQRANNAVEVWGIHGSGKMFMLDCWVGRGKGENPELQVAEHLYEMFQKWDGFVSRGYVEAYGAHASMITVFNMVCTKHGRRYILEPVRDDRGRRSKDVRIRSTVGAAANDRLLCIRASHDQFLNEFSTFPQSKTKDTLDAAAYAVMVLGKKIPLSPIKQSIVKAAAERKRAMRIAHIGRGGY